MSDDGDEPSAVETQDADGPVEQAPETGEETDRTRDGDRETEGTADADGAQEENEEELPAVDEDLVERVETADSETLAGEMAALQSRADEAESALASRQERVEELESKLKRERADFQNYKKRMDERRAAERRRATEDLVGRLLDVRDNLARALDQDEDAEVRDGVESTLGQFDRILADEDVERIEPAPGDEVDPQRHEVLTTVASDEPAGAIADRYRPGYEMAGKVLRPAQVTVSEEEAAAADDDGATGPADDAAGDEPGDGEADAAEADDDESGPESDEDRDRREE